MGRGCSRLNETEETQPNGMCEPCLDLDLGKIKAVTDVLETFGII